MTGADFISPAVYTAAAVCIEGSSTLQQMLKSDRLCARVQSEESRFEMSAVLGFPYRSLRQPLEGSSPPPTSRDNIDFRGTCGRVLLNY